VSNTEELIEVLVDSAIPVRRLRPPLVRAALWLLLAAFVLALIAIAHGVRPDIDERLQQPMFIIGMTSALATAILAAVASFEISLPDASRWWAILPVPALALWFSTVGYGCFTDWISIGPDGIHMGEAVQCFATLLMTSVPLSIAIVIMLRYAALLRPGEVSVTAGLAVAAMTAFALSLFHSLDATVMILMWNLGVAALIAGLASVFGRSIFTWTAARLMPSARSRHRQNELSRS
jgi:hypothetical protein